MEAYNFFIDKEGHLRSGWRLAIFVVAFMVCTQLSQILLFWGLAAVLQLTFFELVNSNWGFVAGHGSILISATLVGWACGALFEQLPFRALGCWPHRGWLKNLGLGSVLGAVTLVLAALLATATRGIHFRFDPAGARSIGETLAVSTLLFIFAAAAEEILFRGYPLQTLTRAKLAWLGVTFVNTALAGVWLAVAYLRTRSLWLPLALHWSWNWAQASLLGLPVSGIERIAPAPLLQAINAGPDWLTGGAYGIEGGAACTIALLISTVVIWRTKLFATVHVPTEPAPNTVSVS